MKKLFCIGDFTVDLIIPFGDMKRAVKGFGSGSEKKVPKFYTQAGGGIANTSIALARLGHDPIIVSKIGTDSCGLAAIDEVRAEGVNTDHLILEDKSAFIIGAVIDEDGERYFSGWQRPDAGNGALLKGETAGIDVTDAGWVHTGGINMHGDTDHEREIVSFIERCKDAGATVSFDLTLRYETSGYSDGK
ncbi:MAG: carbohydrate kinase family protein, partial [Lachnospiraceae bacterium]|nr:carbohydrate kinase family protein [Lachnospiraceae bacterium]